MDRVRLFLTGLFLGLLLATASAVFAQPYSAQIQQALRQMLSGTMRPAVMRPTSAYQAVDGTAGATVTSCTAFKNGLCVSGT